MQGMQIRYENFFRNSETFCLPPFPCTYTHTRALTLKSNTTTSVELTAENDKIKMKYNRFCTVTYLSTLLQVTNQN